MHIWKTFVAVTLLAAAMAAAVGSWFGWTGPVLTTNSMGMVISVGDIVESFIAAAVGVVATFALNRRAKPHA